MRKMRVWAEIQIGHDICTTNFSSGMCACQPTKGYSLRLTCHDVYFNLFVHSLYI